jgi:hypothetical protein
MVTMIVGFALAICLPIMVTIVMVMMIARSKQTNKKLKQNKKLS